MKETLTVLDNYNRHVEVVKLILCFSFEFQLQSEKVPKKAEHVVASVYLFWRSCL